MKKKFLSLLMVLAILFTNLTSFAASTDDTATATDKVRFGVTSDIHVMSDPNHRNKKRAAEALEFFRDQNTDASFIVGDVTDRGYVEEFKNLKDVLDNARRDDYTIHTSMGNHEFYNGLLNKKGRFTEYTGDKPNDHYIINGYHFIMISPDGGNYLTSFSYLKNELAKAKANTGNKPIFVFFHHPIKDTFYVSEEWNGNVPKSIFKDYPMAVTFSGHIHSPNNHPRSIWQGSKEMGDREVFTAVNTVSQYYFEMESGYEDNTYPDKNEDCRQPLIVEAEGTKVTIKTFDLVSGDWINQVWTFDTSDPDNFPYTDKRYAQSKPPVFDENANLTIEPDKRSVNITIDQAKVGEGSVEGDIVHSYEIEIYQNDRLAKKQKIWSNFHMIPMPETRSYTIGSLKPGNDYTMEVYPVNAFKKRGEPLVKEFKTLGNVNEKIEVKEIFDVDFRDRPDGTEKYGHNMTVYGEPEKIANAMHFDGVNDALRYDTNKELYKAMNDDGFTFEFMYKPYDLGKNNNPIGNLQGSGIGLEQKGGTDELEFWAHIGGDYVVPSIKYENEKYIHFTATYNKEELKLYKDGELVDTIKRDGDLTVPPFALYLGTDTGGDGSPSDMWSNSDIKLAKIYSGAMTDEEVKESYLANIAKDKEDEDTPTETNKLRFGVISDIHVGARDIQATRTTEAIDKLKEMGAEVTFINGDDTDNGSKVQYDELEKALKPSKDQNYPVYLNMGNHDFYAKESDQMGMFTNATGSKPFDRYEINGYQFIMVSPDKIGGNDVYNTAREYLKEELKIASEKSNGNPIFVFAHHPVNGTHFTSESWSGDLTKDVFKDYPNVVLFSGHNHATNNLPNLIWQDDFTTVNLPSLYYAEFQFGYPTDSDGQWQGLILDVDGSEVSIKTWDFKANDYTNQVWKFDTKGEKPYQNVKDKVKAPEFKNGDNSILNITPSRKSVELEFEQAAPYVDEIFNNPVFEYQYDFTDENGNVINKKDNPDFHITPMPTSHKANINGLEAGTKYSGTITPVDSSGNKGTPIKFEFTTEGAKGERDPIYNLVDINLTERPDGSEKNGRKVELFGEPKFTTDGDLNKVYFNGKDSSLRIETDSDMYNKMKEDGFSVEMYLNPIDLGPGKDQLGNTQSSGFGYEGKSDNDMTFWISLDGGYKEVAIPMTENEWAHLVTTWDKNEVRVYKNGELIVTEPASGNFIEPPHYLFLGSDTKWDGSPEFFGESEYNIARIYSGVMNEEEVKDAYGKIAKEEPKPVETEEIEVEKVTIPFKTKSEDDSTLEKGKTRVKQEGIDGEKEITKTYKVIDGKRQENPTITEKIIKAPVDKIILVGTKVVEPEKPIKPTPLEPSIPVEPVETEETEVEKVAIPFTTKYEDDSTLEKGKTRVKQEGIDGEKEITKTYKVIDGKRQENPTITEKIIKAPVDKIILVGTKVVEPEKPIRPTPLEPSIPVYPTPTPLEPSIPVYPTPTPLEPSIPVYPTPTPLEPSIPVEPRPEYPSPIRPDNNRRYNPFVSGFLFGNRATSNKVKPVEPKNIEITDITGHWAEKSVREVVNKGYMELENGKFFPNVDATRLEYVKALAKLAKVNPKDYMNKTVFKDVKSGTTDAGYINWANEKGIIKGTGEGDFEGDRNITRQEIATILNRYEKAMNLNLSKKDAVDFSDNDKIADWAKADVKEAHEKGIFNGKDNNMFDPISNITRAEVAQVVVNMDK